MKKSSKLLLGGFLTILFCFTAMHVALYAKYKNGTYKITNDEDESLLHPLQPFPHTTFVSIRNVKNATVVFSDMAYQNIHKNSAVEYVQKGDTLLVYRRDSARTEGYMYPVTFNIPYNATLSVFNSTLFLKTGKSPRVNPVIYLQKSIADFWGRNEPIQLGDVKIVA